jgi:hypothetical protein
MTQPKKVFIVAIALLVLTIPGFAQTGLKADASLKIYQNRSISYFGVHPVKFSGATSGKPATFVSLDGYGMDVEGDSTSCLGQVSAKNTFHLAGKNTFHLESGDTLLTTDFSGNGNIPQGKATTISQIGEGVYGNSINPILQWSNLKWVYNNTDTAIAGPDHGFRVTTGAFNLYNEDNFDFSVRNCKYLKNQTYVTAQSLWSSSLWATAPTIPDFTLSHNDSITRPLPGMAAGSFLFLRFDIYRGDTLVASEIDVQEIPATGGIYEKPLTGTGFLTISASINGSDIHYQLNQSGLVNIAIYSTDGRKIKTLVNTNQAGGSYTISWDGNDSQGSRVASGVYFCRLETNGTRVAEKMIRVR